MINLSNLSTINLTIPVQNCEVNAQLIVSSFSKEFYSRNTLFLVAAVVAPFYFNLRLAWGEVKLAWLEFILGCIDFFLMGFIGAFGGHLLWYLFK